MGGGAQGPMVPLDRDDNRTARVYTGIAGSAERAASSRTASAQILPVSETQLPIST